MAPTSAMAAEAVAEEEAGSLDTSEKIREEQEQISRVQAWWSRGGGESAVARSAVLSAFDEALLSELIVAGGGYHTILTADRLDGMHRRLGSGTEPSLEPLRKALQTRGGSKSQARVVGMLVFREARALYEQAQGIAGPPAAVAAPSAAPAAAQAAGSEAAAAPAEEASAVKLEEQFSPPRLFVCSDSYPEGAQMAVRSAPNQRGDILATVPAGTEYMATGRVGDYLQVEVMQNGVTKPAYVLHTLGDLILLVPAAPQPAAAAAAPPPPAPAAATREAAPAVAADEASGQETAAAAAAAAAVAAAQAAQVAAAAASAASESRVEALEAKVAQQDRQLQLQEKTLQALQTELAMLRAQLGAVATAFKPIAVGGA